MSSFTTIPLIFNFIPAEGGEMVNACSNCVEDRHGHTEGQVPNYGDESCSFCDFTTADEEEEETEDWEE